MKSRIRKLILALNKEKGTTVVLTTHDRKQASGRDFYHARCSGRMADSARMHHWSILEIFIKRNHGKRWLI